jgi:hypothetical protein
MGYECALGLYVHSRLHASTGRTPWYSVRRLSSALMWRNWGSDCSPAIFSARSWLTESFNTLDLKQAGLLMERIPGSALLSDVRRGHDLVKRPLRWRVHCPAVVALRPRESIPLGCANMPTLRNQAFGS